jgi:hypothetical protein
MLTGIANCRHFNDGILLAMQRAVASRSRPIQGTSAAASEYSFTA